MGLGRSAPDIKSFIHSVADPKILKRGGGGAEDNVSVPSSFISNAHNEIYAFNTEKTGFLINI